MIKFVKAADSPTDIKTNKVETVRKSSVRYAEMKNWPKNNFAYKNVTPRADLLKTGRTPIAVNRINMNGAQPKRTFFTKPAHSYVRRPFQRKSAVRTQFRVPMVSTVTRKFLTVDSKFSTVKSTSTADLGNKGKAGNSQNNIDDKGYWDIGCSRHMTGNISYLSDYEPYDGGYVSFGQGGGKITGKSIIRTDFKLKDDTNVLFRTPRQHNMYSIDLNNIVPHKDLTCLVAKDSADETKTMLADAKLPVTFWAEAVNAACYAQNRVLVNKSHNKTPYEIFNSRTPALGFLKPFGCHVMILNTLDHLGKFEAKGDEGYFIGYSMSSKAFRVFNKRTKKLEENLHVDFLENKLIEKGAGPNWLFDIDTLTNSMNYAPVHTWNLLQVMLKILAMLLLLKAVNSNLTATSKNPPAKQMESLTVEPTIPTVNSHVLTACIYDSLEPSSDTRLISKKVTSQDETPSLDNISTLSKRFEGILGVTPTTVDTNEVEADLSNMESIIPASPTPTFGIHKDHPKSQIIGPVDTPVQTRHQSKDMEEHSFIATIHQKTNPNLLQFCLFSCFLSQEEPKKIFDALKNSSWVEAMQEELLQFKIQDICILVDCPKVVRPIGTKWVLKNKKDKRGIVIRNQARLVAQGYTQEEGIDYEELCREFEALMHDKFQMSAIGELNFFLGLQVLQKKDSIFLSQNKYVGDILKKFRYSDVRSMIGSLMYLTASRPDIMFAVCACARHQLTPKECHLDVVKRIFGYLKGHAKLGLWYPKESPFNLVANSDSDYGGATQDRKSTTGGCQFLERRLISWQCKKQSIVATSTTEAEYVAAASGCGQVPWIQNHMLDYGNLTMARLAFCDYHNMIAILEKSKHNIDFHQIVDFVEASHIRYALTINPTVYVSHIRQFWSTARIETTNEGTKILATVDGKPKTISESSIRRNLKLNDEEGISTLPNAELFKNLALMGYNILPNKKFTFQKGQFSHQWKFLVHTIMQCLSTKSTGFNEFSSNIATVVSKALPTTADEPTSPLGDDSQGEAFPTIFGLEVGHDRENIIKTSILPHDSTTRVTSLEADEGSMQQQLQELTDLCTCLLRQQTEMANKIEAQDLEISSLKAWIKLLEDKDKGTTKLSGDDAPIKERNVSVPHVTEVSTVGGVPTVNGLVPTVSAIFTTASVVTPYSRRPRQILAKDKEEGMDREDQRLNEQIAKGTEIARIHAEEELKMMIDGLDRNNEMIAKHLHEGMTFEEIREKFIPVWKQIEDFAPMALKEEGERVKRKGLKLEQGSAKNIRTSDDVSKEYLKEMMQLVPIEEVYVEALQVKHPIIDWEIHTEGKKDYWKIIRQGGHTVVYQFFVDMLKQIDREDLNQL
nr:uncharacterized mitochondrial protein AtMg00810-like [Tanacetum cinerariifolium]